MPFTENETMHPFSLSFHNIIVFARKLLEDKMAAGFDVEEASGIIKIKDASSDNKTVKLCCEKLLCFSCYSCNN